MSWTPADASQAIDPKDLNGGILVADYEHDLGARITVEDLGDAAHFAITCGIYGWFFHTRFFFNKPRGRRCRLQRDADSA